MIQIIQKSKKRHKKSPMINRKIVLVHSHQNNMRLKPDQHSNKKMVKAKCQNLKLKASMYLQTKNNHPNKYNLYRPQILRQIKKKVIKQIIRIFPMSSNLSS